jgi:uncharacterized membrane protein YsdA (DUF1294 family)
MIQSLLTTDNILLFLAGVNGLLFVFYGLDKYFAKQGYSRVPEKTLHLLMLVGGTPAALIARPLFRHKTKKQSFKNTFMFILMLQVAGFLGWFFLIFPNQ